MKRIFRISDPALLLLAGLATLMGLFLIFDAGYPRSLGSNHGLLPKEFRDQALFALVGPLAAWVCTRLTPTHWLKASKWIWLACLVSIVLVDKIGFEMNGARRWLQFHSVTVQPAEFAKLAVILYLAAVFADRKPWPSPIKPRRDWAHWMDTIAVPKIGRAIPALTVLVAVYFIEKEPDLGTAAVIAVTAFSLFVLGGVSKKSLAAAMVIAVGGCWVLVEQQPYRLERIQNHVQRWAPNNVDDTSYQTVQSELAMASGGVTGIGIGNGRAKYVIPATTTDFIMATVAEEFGLLGCLVVLGIIGGFVWRLLYLAGKAPSRYARLVLFGIGAWIGIQACVNVMMANGFLPAIGIPFPFISSGGSSLLSLWCAVGISQSLLSAPILSVKGNLKQKPRNRDFLRNSNVSRLSSEGELSLS